MNSKDDTIKTRPQRSERSSFKQNGYFTAICVVVGLIIVGIFIYLNINETYNNYKIIDSYARDDNNTKEYISYDKDKIIRYSNDGITAMDGKGNLLWTGSYEMKNPKAVICDKYVAVADIGYTDVYVFDGSGNQEKIDNTLTVEQVEVSSRGMVALLVSEGMANYIKISDGSKNYIDIKTRLREDGYPIDLAFSPDSKKLVTSYMSVESGKTSNYVTCYNFGEVGKSYESKIVAGYSYDDKLVPEVTFLDDTTFVIFTEDSFEIYEMKEIPVKKYASDTFVYKIKSVFYTDEYIGIALDNDKDYVTELRVYTTDGKEKFNEKTDYEYNSIYMSEDNIVMNTSKDALIYNVSGKIKFNGTFDKDFEYILPFNNKDKFYFINSQNVLKVKLTEGD